jgi:type 1 glutamine amidotransferase
MKTLLILSFLLPPLEFWAQPYEVLHYTETTGYNHGTKSVSLNMFNSWAAQDNYTVTNDDNGNEFNTLANLQQFNVVIFSNTSGSSGLNATQRANFEAYIGGGGSYLGIHAASDTYRHSSANGSSTGNWDWYAETVAGASVQQNPNHTSSNHNNTMTHSEPNHPILSAVPSPWNKTEEYYYWENGYLSPDFTELLRVGQTGSNSRDNPRMMAHCRDLPGGGRAFYTALGHSGSNYTNDQNFRQLIHDALIWVMQGATTFDIDEEDLSEARNPVLNQSEIVSGYIVLPEPSLIESYRVYDNLGQLLHTGLIEENRIKLISNPSPLNYVTYEKVYKVSHQTE